MLSKNQNSCIGLYFEDFSNIAFNIGSILKKSSKYKSIIAILNIDEISYYFADFYNIVYRTYNIANLYKIAI